MSVRGRGFFWPFDIYKSEYKYLHGWFIDKRTGHTPDCRACLWRPAISPGEMRQGNSQAFEAWGYTWEQVLTCLYYFYGPSNAIYDLMDG